VADSDDIFLNHLVFLFNVVNVGSNEKQKSADDQWSCKISAAVSSSLPRL